MKQASIHPLKTMLLFVALASVPSHGQESQRQYLSGHGKDDAVPWRFICTSGANSGSWTNIPVPSNWDALGFGTLSYRTVATNSFGEQGLYEHDFTVPANWSGRRVFLVFDGVMTDTQAKLNGQSVGPVHQGGFYRFKYEVTKLLKPDITNRLEVTVDKHSANASVNRAERAGDYWFFGGIYRPVYLEAVPPQFVDRVAIDARADGAFTVDVFANGASGADTVEAQITDLDGKPVGPTFTGKLAEGKATLKTSASAPRQWTAETPTLYRVEVRLKQGGQTVHAVQQRFGFRTFEVREGDGLYLNGRRVVLKGVNRHSFWPDSGRCLSEAVHRMDIEAMKDMNMNAVRMSHYPPDEQFLDLCDELGLYVLDELAGWHARYDTPTGRKLIEEMIIRDVNHPSILFWDNGNEGGWNREIDGDFARWDPQQRRVLHPWELFGGVNTDHYETYESTKKLCASTNIFMPTEFLHGLYDGGLGAGFEDYWDVMSQSKVCAGGFFWVLADEGLKRADTGQIDTAGNQAPDGLVGPYREREGSFYTIKELWSPIVVTRETNGTLTVKNHYSFTDVNQCGFTWELLKFRNPDEEAAVFKVIAKGAIPAPSLPPGGMSTLKLELPDTFELADALAVRVADPTGRELWTWVWQTSREDSFRKLVTTPAKQPAAVTETSDALAIKVSDLTVRISKQTGMLDAVQRGAQKFSLANGPRPAAGEAKLVSLERRKDGSDDIVSATYTGDLKSVTWRMRGNGWLQCDYAFAAEGPKDFLGVAFDYPESQVKGKKWLGDGPYRVWKNRLRGVTLNVWENDYNNTITGWKDWVYPEFKGCFANVRWMQLKTTEGPITAVLGRDDLFVQVLTPEVPPKDLVAQTVVSLPQAGIAFLHALPPIGSKFHPARESGPQSQPTMAKGEYTGSVSFYFGKLP